MGRPKRGAADGRLAHALRDQRERLGWTRQQLASRASLSINTLMALEQGRTEDPGFFKVGAVCRALGVVLDDLHAEVSGQRSPATATRSTADTPTNKEESPMSHGIVSVGYEGRDIDAFVSELVAAGVDTVADVRLNPISRKPGFSKTRLTEALERVGISYVHLRSLGNPKSNREPFWSGRAEEGKAVFRGLLEASDSSSALQRLSDMAGDQVVAVLCFENDHEQCHRQVVIDEVTRAHPVPVLALR
ncbi:MAG: DUF488 family protein [Nocardioidaceae bacterium]|nr:DUF488 family protein [Nocardioidaceae bacterium]